MLLFPPQWYHHFLLPSIFLLLNLLPHSFSSFILWNTSVNFPRNPLGANLGKKSFAPVMGTLSDWTKREMSITQVAIALTPYGQGTPFWLFSCWSSVFRGSVRGLGYHSFLSFPEPAISPPSFLFLDAHVSGIHTHGNTVGGKHQRPHTWSLGAKGRVTEHSVMRSVHFSGESCWLKPSLCCPPSSMPASGALFAGRWDIFFLCIEVTSIPQTLHPKGVTFTN